MSYTFTADFDIGGVNASKVVPDAYAGAPTPVVVYYHGVGGSASGMLYDPTIAGMTVAMATGGWIVAGSNAHGDSWGNADAMTDIGALYAYLIANYNVSHVLHLGHSMGGIVALNAIGRGVIPCAGFNGIFPVCSLAAAYANDGIPGYPGLFVNSIEAAYDFDGGGEYAAATSGYDPLLFAAGTFSRCPMKFWTSPDDVYVPDADHSLALRDAIAPRARWETSVHHCTGNHGDPSHFNTAAVVAFYQRCLVRPHPYHGTRVTFRS